MSKSSRNKSGGQSGSPLRMHPTAGARHTPSKDRSSNILQVHQPLRDRSEEAKSVDRHKFIHRKFGDHSPSVGRHSPISGGPGSKSSPNVFLQNMKSPGSRQSNKPSHHSGLSPKSPSDHCNQDKKSVKSKFDKSTLPECF